MLYGALFQCCFHFVSFLCFCFFSFSFVFLFVEKMSVVIPDVDGSGREWWSKERKPAAGCLLKTTIQEASNRSFRHRANHTHTSNNNDVNNISSYIYTGNLSVVNFNPNSIDFSSFFFFYIIIDRTRTEVNQS